MSKRDRDREGEVEGDEGGSKKPTKVIDQIVSAIRELKACDGSSSQAISKLLNSKFDFENKEVLKKALKTGVSSGILEQCKSSFKVKGDPQYESTAEKVTIETVALGSGDLVVEKGHTVEISYVGTLAEGGHQFDAGKSFRFEVGGGDVIKGMDAGVLGMKIGGERKVTIPSTLGYGKRGSSPDIPPLATLIFIITLKKIV